MRARVSHLIFLWIWAVIGALFFLIPLVSLAWNGPWEAGWEKLDQPGIRQALTLSLITSGSAVVLSIVLGFPLAWILARRSFFGCRLFRTLILLPMVLPPVVAGVALLGAFGRKGVLNYFLEPLGIQLSFTLAGAIIAATFVSAPFFILTLEAGLANANRKWEEAAATLGATPSRVFWKVTLPSILPSFLAGIALAWARALGEFGATITFAGNMPGKTQTLPLAIYQTFQEDFEGAILLSLILVGVSLVVLFLLRGRLFSK